MAVISSPVSNIPNNVESSSPVLNTAIFSSPSTMEANVPVVNETDVDALDTFQGMASVMNIYSYKLLLFPSLYLLFSINKEGSDSGRRRGRGKGRGRGRGKRIIEGTSLPKTRSSKRIKNSNGKIAQNSQE